MPCWAHGCGWQRLADPTLNSLQKSPFCEISMILIQSVTNRDSSHIVVIADCLALVWHQNICNSRDDVARPAYINIAQRDVRILVYIEMYTYMRHLSTLVCVQNLSAQRPRNTVTQWTHIAIITSLLRQNDITTSFWCNSDVIIVSCVRWDVGKAILLR